MLRGNYPSCARLGCAARAGGGRAGEAVCGGQSMLRTFALGARVDSGHSGAGPSSQRVWGQWVLGPQHRAPLSDSNVL